MVVIIAQTLQLTKEVSKFVVELGLSGGKILFVGTKKQAQESIINAANKAGAFYITNRWLGGTLTNFETIKNRIRDLNKLESNKTGDKPQSKSIFELTKRETQKIEKNLSRLQKHFSGIKDMKKIPDALFVVDVAKEDIAVKEASKLNIPIIALVDTDGDPTPIEHILPGNDDAIRSIQLATSLVADNYVYGRQLRLEKLAEIAKQKELEKSEKQKISSEIAKQKELEKSEKQKISSEIAKQKELEKVEKQKISSEIEKNTKDVKPEKTQTKKEPSKTKQVKTKQTKKESENKKTTPKKES